MSTRSLPALSALLALLLVVPVGAFAAGTRSVDPSAESTSFSLVNQARSSNGLPALVSNAELVTIAREHSEAMARDVESGGSCGDGTTLRHRSPISAGITATWKTLRENVGCGYGSSATAEAVHTGFMNSPGHRANILANDINQVGIGAFRDVNGGLWVTQIFVHAPLPVVAPTPATVHAGVEASRATFADGAAGFAVVARADDFADSLGGAALAGGEAPVLYTPAPSSSYPNPSLDPNTRAELDRVLGGSGRVYLLGGTVAIGSAVADELRAAGYTVTRLEGPTRHETAIAVANAIIAREGAPGRILIAYGRNWPDAVTGGAAAARNGLPIVLAERDHLTDSTKAFLAKHPGAKRVVLGGPAVVTDSVVSSLGATRVAGAERAATAVKIAEQLFGTTPGGAVVLDGYAATGWAAAMAWSSRAVQEGRPQLLVSSTDVPGVTADYLQAHSGELIFSGGVTSTVRTTLSSLGG